MITLKKKTYFWWLMVDYFDGWIWVYLCVFVDVFMCTCWLFWWIYDCVHHGIKVCGVCVCVCVH